MKYNDIQWEDDDEDLAWESDKKRKNQKQQSEAEDFASMLDEAPMERQRIAVGHQITGTLVTINSSSQTALVELDAQHTGVIDLHELQNDEGEIQAHLGDAITAYVISRRGGDISLSKSLSQSQSSLQDLQLACENQVPVKGKVTGENPGGFDVTILGKRCFCPVSQIDSRFVQAKAEFVGKEFSFLIEKVEEGGRNIVVSRSKLLQREAAEKLAQLESNLKSDVVLDGIVREVRDYGAFVDIGGIDGFLHISEMSYARLSRASDFVAKGDQVRVKVLSIQEQEGKKRISLSMKAVEDDPWTLAGERYRDGQSYKGRVTRLESYGAFVELELGVEGLVHISEMSWEKRLHHPQEMLKVGDFVNVRVLSIDLGQKKISLSLKNIEEDPWLLVSEEHPLGSQVEGQVESLKGFGAIVGIGRGLSGLIPMATLKKAFGESYKKHSSPPKSIKVNIRDIDLEAKKILLGLPDVSEDESNQDAFQAYVKEQQLRKEKARASGSGPKRGTFGDLLASQLEKKQKR